MIRGATRGFVRKMNSVKAADALTKKINGSLIINTPRGGKLKAQRTNSSSAIESIKLSKDGKSKKSSSKSSKLSKTKDSAKKSDKTSINKDPKTGSTVKDHPLGSKLQIMKNKHRAATKSKTMSLDNVTEAGHKRHNLKKRSYPNGNEGVIMKTTDNMIDILYQYDAAVKSGASTNKLKALEKSYLSLGDQLASTLVKIEAKHPGLSDMFKLDVSGKVLINMPLLKKTAVKTGMTKLGNRSRVFTNEDLFDRMTQAKIDRQTVNTFKKYAAITGAGAVPVLLIWSAMSEEDY